MSFQPLGSQQVSMGSCPLTWARSSVPPCWLFLDSLVARGTVRSVRHVLQHVTTHTLHCLHWSSRERVQLPAERYWVRSLTPTCSCHHMCLYCLTPTCSFITCLYCLLSNPYLLLHHMYLYCLTPTCSFITCLCTV